MDALQTSKTVKAKMKLRTKLAQIWTNTQLVLFPLLENKIGSLPENYKQLISVLELIRIEEYMPDYSFYNGRPPKDRAFIARAFIAKIILKITFTKQLVNLLESDVKLKEICGWESFQRIPSESKFSRVFAEFSDIGLPDIVHQKIVSEFYESVLIENLVCDSTSIKSREKPLKKKGSYKERKNIANKRYLREKKGEKSRKQKQISQNLHEMLDELPKECDFGAKKGSNGFKMTWKGHKLHVAVDDNAIPISAILTSASLNDCEVAIPLLKKVSKSARHLYCLFDSAYDVKELKEFANIMGTVAIIDEHARSKKQKEEKQAEKLARKTFKLETAKDRRYKQRFSKERFNGSFKDFYGGNNIFYKGHKKIFCNSMFGILAYTAICLLNLVN